MVERIRMEKARVGLLAVGHHTYWDQFDGLLEEMHHKIEAFRVKLERQDVDVISFGLSDCAETAYDRLPKIQAADLDLLFIDMVTYATSSSIACIFREISVPMVMVALQPLSAMDYSNATTRMQLLNDDICSMPEFANVAHRMGKQVPPLIIGTLQEDPDADAEIADYCRIARVLHGLRKARIGQMGHVLESMLDMHTDPTLITATFGCHIVQTEPEEILKFYRMVGKQEAEVYADRILQFFDTPDPVSDPITERLRLADLHSAARAGVALQHFIDERKLDGLAYYYEGEEESEMRNMVSSFIVGNSLLTASGFPMCGEMDIKTCIAMMIMDRLGIGGSFAEFHPVDFNEGFVLVGHDGPHHINIAEGKPVLRSLKRYHGKPGHGASVEFKIKEGPITMLGVTQQVNGRFKFVIAEGASRSGPIPPTGNTNTRGFFLPEVRTFLKRWFAEAPTHHFALGVGHEAAVIAQLGEFLGIETVIIPKT